MLVVLIALAFTTLAHFATGTPADLVDSRLVGNYKLDEDVSKLNPKFMEAIGLTPDQIKEVTKLFQHMTMKVTVYNGKVRCILKTKGKTVSNEFEEGKIFEMKLLMGKPVKAIPTSVSNNKVVMDVYFAKGNATFVTDCDPTGCAVIGTVEGSNEIEILKWKRDETDGGKEKKF